MGIDRQELLGTKAQPVGAGGLKILDKHVAAFHQLMENLQPFRLAQVQRYRPLVTVARQVIGAQLAGERRAPAAGLVAAAGALNLDDVRTEVAEELPAKWPGQHA